MQNYYIKVNVERGQKEEDNKFSTHDETEN